MESKEKISEQDEELKESTEAYSEQASPEREAETVADQVSEHNESVADEDQAADAEENKVVEQLKQQNEATLQKLLRVQADFENYKRRTRQEKEEFAKYASQRLIEQLLPVIDNFERAVVSSRESADVDALKKGVEMIFGQLNQVLEHEQVRPIEATGELFNPEFHQAVMQVESDEHEEGIVVEEIQKGYMLKDKVIRPAMVKVSQ